VWINAFFVISKGITKKICPKGYEIWICNGTGGKVDGWVALGFSCALGLFVAIVCIPAYAKIRRTVDMEFPRRASPRPRRPSTPRRRPSRRALRPPRTWRAPRSSA
jgi:hypothetical protein